MCHARKRGNPTTCLSGHRPGIQGGEQVLPTEVRKCPLYGIHAKEGFQAIETDPGYRIKSGMTYSWTPVQVRKDTEYWIPGRGPEGQDEGRGHEGQDEDQGHEGQKTGFRVEARKDKAGVEARKDKTRVRARKDKRRDSGSSRT